MKFDLQVESNHMFEGHFVLLSFRSMIFTRTPKWPQFTKDAKFKDSGANNHVKWRTLAVLGACVVVWCATRGVNLHKA